MESCQLCNNTEIPQKVYDLLDWEAAAADELIICPKCLAGLMKKEATVQIKLQKPSAILVKILWKKGEEDEETPG